MSVDCAETRREFEVEARRRAIVEATERLLAERDVEDTSMEVIAEAVGYTRRTLYAYFSGRDEILLLVLVRDLERRWREQQRHLTEVETGIFKLQTWARTLYAHSRAHPHTVRLQAYWDFRGIDRIAIGSATLARFEELNNELADGLRQIFALGIGDGSLRPELEVDLCISQFLYTLRIVIHRALSPGYSFVSHDPDVYVDHFIDLLTRGLTPERTPHGT
jgi:AcrR family transcriptional regulator